MISRSHRPLQKPIYNLRGILELALLPHLSFSKLPNPFLAVKGRDWISPTLAANVYLGHLLACHRTTTGKRQANSQGEGV